MRVNPKLASGSTVANRAAARSPLAQPFSLVPASSAQARGAVLVVHGFGGSPFEMRPIGEALCAAGFVVDGPQLAGHATGNHEFAASTWRDWVDSIDAAFTALSARTSPLPVYLCGQSLGGLICLELGARHRPVAAIASLAAPIWLHRAAQFAATWLGRASLLRRVVIPRLAGSDVADPEMKRRNGEAVGPLGLPIAAVGSLLDFMHYLRPRLGMVRVPTLLIHAHQDHVAPYACMAAIAAAIGNPGVTVETLSLERSFHLISLDVERLKVFDAVIAHFGRTS